MIILLLSLLFSVLSFLLLVVPPSSKFLSRLLTLTSTLWSLFLSLPFSYSSWLVALSLELLHTFCLFLYLSPIIYIICIHPGCFLTIYFSNTCSIRSLCLHWIPDKKEKIKIEKNGGVTPKGFVAMRSCPGSWLDNPRETGFSNKWYEVRILVFQGVIGYWLPIVLVIPLCAF